MSRTVTSVSSVSSSRNLPPLSTAALNSASLSLGMWTEWFLLLRSCIHFAPLTYYAVRNILCA